MRQKVITIIRSFGEVLLWKPPKRPFYFEDKLRSVDVNGVVIRQTKKSNGEITRVVIDKLKIVSWGKLKAHALFIFRFNVSRIRYKRTRTNVINVKFKHKLTRFQFNLSDFNRMHFIFSRFSIKNLDFFPDYFFCLQKNGAFLSEKQLGPFFNNWRILINKFNKNWFINPNV